MQIDQLLAKLEYGAGLAGGPADQRVQPRQDPLVLAGRAGRQLCDGLVGRDGEGLQFDQGVLVAGRRSECEYISVEVAKSCLCALHFALGAE